MTNVTLRRARGQPRLGPSRDNVYLNEHNGLRQFKQGDAIVERSEKKMNVCLLLKNNDHTKRKMGAPKNDSSSEILKGNIDGTFHHYKTHSMLENVVKLSDSTKNAIY